jgi:hypothetical protein
VRADLDSSAAVHARARLQLIDEWTESMQAEEMREAACALLWAEPAKLSALWDLLMADRSSLQQELTAPGAGEAPQRAGATTPTAGATTSFGAGTPNSHQAQRAVGVVSEGGGRASSAAEAAGGGNSRVFHRMMDALAAGLDQADADGVVRRDSKLDGVGVEQPVTQAQALSAAAYANAKKLEVARVRNEAREKEEMDSAGSRVAMGAAAREREGRAPIAAEAVRSSVGESLARRKAEAERLIDDIWEQATPFAPML